MAKTTKSTEMKVPLLAGVGVGPAGNAPRVAREELVEETPDVPLEKGKDKAELYRERLRKAGITETEARKVMDEVLFGGAHIRSVHLTPEFQVELTTRAYGDTLRVMRVLEAEAPTFQMHVNDVIARYNLAASLHRYGDTAFSSRDAKDAAKDEEAFQERLDFILSLPEMAVRRLIDELTKFDTELSLIFSEGSVEDF